MLIIMIECLPTFNCELVGLSNLRKQVFWPRIFNPDVVSTFYGTSDVHRSANSTVMASRIHSLRLTRGGIIETVIIIIIIIKS